LSFRASGHGLILLGDVLDAFFGSHGFDFLPPPTDAVTIWPNLVVVPKHEGHASEYRARCHCHRND